jgi:hypothetical protein
VRPLSETTLECSLRVGGKFDMIREREHEDNKLSGAAFLEGTQMWRAFLPVGRKLHQRSLRKTIDRCARTAHAQKSTQKSNTELDTHSQMPVRKEGSFYERVIKKVASTAVLRSRFLPLCMARKKYK